MTNPRISSTEITPRPRLLTIAASDSSGGAGLHADAQVAALMAVDATVLVSAVTAQSSYGVRAVEPLPLSFAEQQWQALLLDGPADAVRVGWLADLAQWLPWLTQKLNKSVVVWDPVLSASQGGLSSTVPSRAELSAWLACCRVVTPNRSELAQLAAWLGVRGDESEQAQALLSCGCHAVVVTGGDEGSDSAVADAVTSRVYASACEGFPEQAAVPVFQMQQRRQPFSVHGSGCHFSAALAAALAQGQRLYDAVIQAAVCMQQWLQQPSRRDSGYHHIGADRSWHWYQLPAAAWPAIRSANCPSVEFAKQPTSLGLYGLVDTLDWLGQLLELGVDTLQWRVKQPGPAYRQQMQQAIECCRQAAVPLYINDDWQAAIELGAYGVHLGQEDLASADLSAIAKAGLRLGISTHTDFEVLRAWQLRPSYIAFGPVHPPLSKQLKYPPLGYSSLSRWWQALRPHLPLTCIGGITEDNISDVLACGVDSCAIVTALRPDADLVERHASIRALWPRVTAKALEIV